MTNHTYLNDLNAIILDDYLNSVFQIIWNEINSSMFLSVEKQNII